MFSGGSDLDPELYDAEAHPETDGVIRERDEFELGVMQAALARDLEQHVPDRVGADTHKEVSGVFADHDVSIDAGTKLREILGDRHDVKSHHHQGFGRVGDGLRVSAHAPDGTVEGLEDPTRRFTGLRST